MEGRIVGLTCGTYSVLKDGVFYKVPAKGIFRIKSKKPVVGDYVTLDSSFAVISSIKERTSLLKRPPISNVDQILIIESLAEPEFSYLLAFKYLTYANMNGIEAKIVLTKSDKFDDENKIKEIFDCFNKLGIEVLLTSSKVGNGIEKTKYLFKDKTSCLIGQSGAGKSSLLNAIDPNFEREIGEYSIALNRGKHKTKEVVLLPYEGGYVADTPGFSSLDLDLTKEDLAKFFPGFNKIYTECFYSNCLHISEKNCVIKEKVENGEIPKIAYECYLKLSSESVSEVRRFY